MTKFPSWPFPLQFCIMIRISCLAFGLVGRNNLASACRVLGVVGSVTTLVLWSSFGLALVSHISYYMKMGCQMHPLFKEVQRTLRNLQHIIMGLRVRHRISQTKPAASLYIVPLPVGSTGYWSYRKEGNWYV